MNFKILARGETWVVISKPTAVAVHRFKPTARPAVIQLLRNQLGQYVWPVHRLDRPTSGCLLVALGAEHVEGLHQALAAGSKHYLAHVRGNMRQTDPVTVTKPLKDDRGVVQEAQTVVRRLGGADEPRSSLVLASPSTGRTHQIRRHLNFLTHPVLCDSSHGDTRVNRAWRQEHDLGRLALHCWQLHLKLPDGTELHTAAPFPRDLGRIWRAQPWWEEAAQALAPWEALCKTP